MTYSETRQMIDDILTAKSNRVGPRMGYAQFAGWAIAFIAEHACDNPDMLKSLQSDLKKELDRK